MLGFLWLFMVSTVITDLLTNSHTVSITTTTNVPKSMYNLYGQIEKRNYTINIYLMLCYMSAKRQRQKQTIPEGEGKRSSLK